MADQNRNRPQQHIECLIEGVGDVKLSAKLKEIRHDRLKLSSADSIPEDATITLHFDNSRYQLKAAVQGYVTKARNNPTVPGSKTTVTSENAEKLARNETPVSASRRPPLATGSRRRESARASR